MSETREPIIKAGDEFWDDQRSEGYKAVVDIYMNRPCYPEQLEHLGTPSGLSSPFTHEPVLRSGDGLVWMEKGMCKFYRRNK
jgi:hypothetical protein